MNKQKAYDIFATFEKFNPNPEGELDYTNIYTLLVAVTLSAQATDKGVNKATKALFEIVKTPQDMVDLGYDELEKHIKTIGLFRSKGKNLIKQAEQLVELHGGEVLNNQEALEGLAGVGRKTANVVRNIGFGEPTIAVDTHLFRVSNRTGLVKAKTPLAVEKALMKRIPKEFLLHAHHWLILHGRYICMARKPKCAACPIINLCEFKDKKFD